MLVQRMGPITDRPVRESLHKQLRYAAGGKKIMASPVEAMGRMSEAIPSATVSIGPPCVVREVGHRSVELAFEIAVLQAHQRPTFLRSQP